MAEPLSAPPPVPRKPSTPTVLPKTTPHSVPRARPSPIAYEHYSRALPSVPTTPDRDNSSYPPSRTGELSPPSARRQAHEHVVPIDTPSPQRRKLSYSSPSQDWSPRKQHTQGRSGRSTSIDLHPSAFDTSYDDRDINLSRYRDSNRHDDDTDEEDAPLMLPFNYRQPPIPSCSKHATSHTVLLGLSRRRILQLNIGIAIAVATMVYLSYAVVARQGSQLDQEKIIGLFSDRRAGILPATDPPSSRMDTIDGLGRDGDTIVMDNGQQFVYRNPFGGTFQRTPSTEAPARAQNDTPTLREEWDYETMTISGVNVGGWLTLEPFITPAMFEPFLNSTTPAPATDEYTLSQNLLSVGGPEYLFKVLDEHYSTFITEKDFADIAAAGLNWVRIPLPFWSVKKWPDEPFLERTSWQYFLKAIEWARKYGLRINLDLHSVPGSQNGWNHSGKCGPINWLHSTMGYANAQRSLDVIESLAEFISRPEIAEVVQMFGMLNEPVMSVIGSDQLKSFYAKAYRTIRSHTGYGANSGAVIALHDGFKGTRRWYNFPSSVSFRDFPPTPETNPSTDASARGQHKTGGMDRVAIDSHRYLAFTEPDLRSVREQILKPCKAWAPEFNKTFNGAGIPIAGEFSLAVNDCGRFVNSVDQGTRLEGTFTDDATGKPLFPPSAPRGSCRFWEDYERWSSELKDSLKDLAYAQMDTFQNWFYWTWKTGRSLEHPQRFANPAWSYSLGVDQGWIPRNPRLSTNFCYAYAARSHLMTEMPRRRARKPKGSMEGWKTGHYLSEHARLIPTEAEVDSSYYPWPPGSFTVDPFSTLASPDLAHQQLSVATLPRYARTASPLVLPGPQTPRNTTLHQSYAPIIGCNYPDHWNPQNQPVWDKVCLSAP